MNTLVLYASKYGNTAKCAEALAKKLRGRVDVKALTDNMPELTGYDTVVLGGSLYAGKLQKEIKAFATTFLGTLMSKRIALFVCCMSEEQGVTQFKAALPDTLVTQALSVERLGGGYAFSKMKGMDKFIIKTALKAEAKKKGTPVTTDFKTDSFTLSEENVTKMAEALNKY